MVHRELTQEINRDFDDLAVRNPQMYRSLEGELRRLKHKTGFAVAMSPVRAERRP
jgi:hypothetical protein